MSFNTAATAWTNQPALLLFFLSLLEEALPALSLVPLCLWHPFGSLLFTGTINTEIIPRVSFPWDHAIVLSGGVCDPVVTHVSCCHVDLI